MEKCIAALIHLNKDAARCMRDFEIHAVTDVTGFGLAGHALEIAKGSGICLEIEVQALPVMDQALEMYRKGVNTGVNVFNQRLAAKHTRFAGKLPPWHEQILYDPQTSGGLLIALPAEQASELVQVLNKIPTPAADVIGRTVPMEEDIYLVFR